MGSRGRSGIGGVAEFVDKRFAHWCRKAVSYPLGLARRRFGVRKPKYI